VTLDQTVAAVEEIIDQYRVDVPGDLHEVVESRVCGEVRRFGYFDGRTVKTGVRSLRVSVKRIVKSDEHFMVRFWHDGEKESVIVNLNDKQEFCDEIADVQDVAVI
jgi:hypothetical protein